MEKLRARLIIEILGKPAEHVEKSLSAIASRLASEKGVKVLHSHINKPILVKDSKDLFSTFAEVEAEFDSLDQYFGILFAYMPSNVELINPEKLIISNSRFSELGNILIQRLHNYETIAKKLVYERNVALRKLQEVAPHLFKKQEKKKKK